MTIQTEAAISWETHNTGFRDLENHAHLQTWAGITLGIILGTFIAKTAMQVNIPQKLFAIMGVIAALKLLFCIKRIIFQKDNLILKTNASEILIFDETSKQITWKTITTSGNELMVPMFSNGFQITKSKHNEGKFLITGKPANESISFVKECIQQHYEHCYKLVSVSIYLSPDKEKDAETFNFLENMCAAQKTGKNAN